MDYIYHYRSPLGDMTLGSDGQTLTGVWFDCQKHYATTISKEAECRSLPIFDNTVAWLDIYFGGEIPDFVPPLTMRGTEFRKTVWKILTEIPYGSTMTYKEIATRIASERGLPHMSAQAVGSAVGHNPISLIVPCHRVIGTNGSLTGYAGGIAIKEQLLRLERHHNI